MNGLATLLFISGATARNLVRRQLTRMRQPRYFAASMMGLLYFWSIFARYGAHAPHGFEVRVGASLTAAGMLAFSMLITLWTWAFGGDEGSLTFGEAEIQFLFPAPLTRRTLVHYKLARTLLLSTVTAAFLTLGLGHRVGAPWLRFFVGAWLAVATVGLHNIAASLTRASLLQHGARGSVRRLLTLLIPAAIAGSIAFALWSKPFPASAAEIPGWFEGMLAEGPLRWTSLPFRPALEVALGVSRTALPLALFSALGSLAAHYLWALGTDADFQDASLASAERRGRRLEQRRRGQLPLRAGRAPFRLAASGHPATAILWKNLTAAVRLLSLRMGVILAIVLAAFAVPVVMSSGEQRQIIAAGVLVMLAGYFTLFGTQVYRIDFRLDLPNIDMLRTLPLRGWEIALGEVLAPVVVVASAQWACLACAAAVVPEEALFHLGRLAPTLAMAVVLPPVTLCLVIVQNTGVLLFPGWVQGGLQGPRGIEAMGQRMLTLVGTVAAAAVALIPASVVGTLVGAVVAMVTQERPLGLVVGALAGAAVLVVEAGFGVVYLGHCFERFDLGQA